MRIVGDESQVYSFGETLSQVRSVAHRLDLEGVAFGDRVALIGENHPCWAIAYLGILYRGAVCVPIDPHGESETLKNFLENSEAKIVFVDEEAEEKVQKIVGRLGRDLPVVKWSASESASDFVSWTSTPFPDAFALEIPKAAGDDVALLIYTSGTTGTPKGVPLTHGNILAELDGINEVLKLTDQEKILSLQPPFQRFWFSHSFG